MNNNYIEILYKTFKPSNEAKLLFDKIIKAPTVKRDEILYDLKTMKEDAGLAYALLALYRQQVNSGFVLADPLKSQTKKVKKFFDSDTGITFRLQWNPDRELRKRHDLLIERGVIAKNIDNAKLINKDKNGKACYLCKKNIDIQNPGEILLEIDLAGDKYYAGANFAYLTNNHFTIMSAEHRPQQYRKKVLEVMNDFIDKTNGHFRAIFNGLAGASIEEHEHLQATTEEFPIEQINIKDKDIIHKSDDLKVSKPMYYVPVWLVEGQYKDNVERIADRIISAWHKINEQKHTENIISVKSGSLFRTFIILRDKTKLAGDKAVKKGAMAAFETGGNIVLSYEPENNIRDVNERQTFNNSSLEKIKQLLKEISPEEQSCVQLHKEVTSTEL